MHLFPQADVPVVQVALPVCAGPADVYALGAALRSLRSQGVLVVGSGSMTHNLAEFLAASGRPRPMCWSSAAGSRTLWPVGTWQHCSTTAARRLTPTAHIRPKTTFCRSSLHWVQQATTCTQST